MQIATHRRKGAKIGTTKVLISLAVAVGANQAAKAANYYVDPNYSGTNGAAYGIYTGAYNSVAAALAATGGVPSGGTGNPNYIYFAPGTYNVGTVSLSYAAKNVDLVGLTGNPSDVVITSTLDSAFPASATSTIGTTGSASVQLVGNNVSASFITFANSTDTPYIVKSALVAESPTGTFPAAGVGTGAKQTSSDPAVALLLNGDEQVFNDCNIVGYQDTLYTKGGRAYFNNCTVSGDDDMIFASGTSVFNNSTINVDSDHSGGAITAASTAKTTSNGLVFLNSTVTGNSTAGNVVTDPHDAGNTSPTAAGSMYLGRPWGWTQAGGDASTVYVNTAMANIINPAGWLAWDANETNAAYKPGGTGPNPNGGNPGEDSRFAEYNTTDLSSNTVNVGSRISWSHQLVTSQASAYTVDNIFSESYPWYGLGYPSTDTDINGAGGPAAGTGSANPSDPNYSWPAYWGDRNINNETTSETAGLTNDPASYADSSWKVGGNWDPTSQLNAVEMADQNVPEPASVTLIGGFLIAPLLRRPRRKLAP